MAKRILGLLTALVLAVIVPVRDSRAAHAYQETRTDRKAAPSVAGRWAMSVKGSPHGDVTMGLELEQSETKVSGTLATPHGDALRVEGEFVQGTLTMASRAEGESRIDMTAKLQEDGTLTGYLSSQMGDMTWTAKRAVQAVSIEADKSRE